MAARRALTTALIFLALVAATKSGSVPLLLREDEPAQPLNTGLDQTAVVSTPGNPVYICGVSADGPQHEAVSGTNCANGQPVMLTRSQTERPGAAPVAPVAPAVPAEAPMSADDVFAPDLSAPSVPVARRLPEDPTTGAGRRPASSFNVVCHGPRPEDEIMSILSGRQDHSTPAPLPSADSERNPASNSPAGAPVIAVMNNAENIGDHARGIEMVQAANASRAATVAAAGHDRDTLKGLYTTMPIAELGPRLERSQKQLEGLAQQLESAADTSLEPGERSRFRNMFFNAADKAAFQNQALRDERKRQSALDDNSPFGSLFARTGPPGADAPSSSRLLADLLGANAPGRSPASAATNDSLLNRLILFNGLPPEEREAAFRRLKLAENARLKLPDGSERTIPILHNGYILGASATGMDCSSFVSSVLPADVRKGRFTTLDFHVMWKYRRTGTFPRPPVYNEPRAKTVRETAEAFTALDVYKGDDPTVGDLLVFRVPNEPIGHIFIVQSYNPSTMMADVIEASQSAGTLRSRDFSLTLDPPGRERRRIRLGLFGLRLKPVSNKVCTYRDHGRGPSAPPRAPAEDRKGGGGAI